MKTHILIYSIVKDLPYLEYCLKSIRKFASGFTGVTVVFPLAEESAAMKWGNEFNFEIENLRFSFYAAPEDRNLWHLKHQAEKCKADLYVPEDTDLVWFLDSDCFLIESVAPEDYITVEGKPILCIESYDRIPSNVWREQTSRALGVSAAFETMRRHGAIHYKKMFPEFRAHIWQVHKKPFIEYVMGGKADFPWHFSEFNALGNYVLISHWNSRYEFWDVGKLGYPPHKMIDVWSHSTPDKAQGDRYRGLFPPEMTVKQIWEKLGL